MTNSSNCPNCGASITNEDNCNYCGSSLILFLRKGIDVSDYLDGKSIEALPGLEDKINLLIKNKKIDEPDFIDINSDANHTNAQFQILLYDLIFDDDKSHLKNNIIFSIIISSDDERENLKKLDEWKLMFDYSGKVKEVSTNLYLDLGPDIKIATLAISKILSKSFGLNKDNILYEEKYISGENLEKDFAREYPLIYKYALIILWVIAIPFTAIYGSYWLYQNTIGKSSQTAAVSTNAGSKSTFNSKYMKYVGAYPIDFLDSKENYPLLEKIRFTNKLAENYFTVGTPIYRERNFIIGSGCKQHECSTSNGIFYLNLDTNFLVIFTATEERVNNFTVKAYCGSCSNSSLDYRNGQRFNYDMPQSVNKWLAERP